MSVELAALKKRLFVDSSVKNVSIFPGSNADATPEDFAREINKFFADAENGFRDSEIVADLDDE
jgi:hypothetical protein